MLAQFLSVGRHHFGGRALALAAAATASRAPARSLMLSSSRSMSSSDDAAGETPETSRTAESSKASDMPLTSYEESSFRIHLDAEEEERLAKKYTHPYPLTYKQSDLITFDTDFILQVPALALGEVHCDMHCLHHPVLALLLPS